MSVLMHATPLEADHTQTSHSFQYEEQSRNWSDLLIFGIPPGKEPVVFLIMELKWVQPVSTDQANIRGFKIDNEPINLDATSFRWAVREAVYQTLWYLYAAGKLCGTSLAVAQVNEFFYRCVRFPDGTLALEESCVEMTAGDGLTAEGEGKEIDSTCGRTTPEASESTSTNTNQPGPTAETHSETNARQPLSITDLDQRESTWGKPPQSLLIRGPDRLPRDINTKSLDLLSLYIYTALYMAGTHDPSIKMQPPPFKSKQKPTSDPSSSDPYASNVDDLPFKAVPIQSDAQSAADIHMLKELVASKKSYRSACLPSWRGRQRLRGTRRSEMELEMARMGTEEMIMTLRAMGAMGAMREATMIMHKMRITKAAMTMKGTNSNGGGGGDNGNNGGNHDDGDTKNDDSDTNNGNDNDGNQESDAMDGLNEYDQGCVGSGQEPREPQEGGLEEQDMWVPSDRDGTFRDDVGGDEWDDWPSDISSNDDQARTRLEILRDKLTKNGVQILPVTSAEMDALVQRISNPRAAVDPVMLSGDLEYYLRLYDDVPVSPSTAEPVIMTPRGTPPKGVESEPEFRSASPDDVHEVLPSAKPVRPVRPPKLTL